MPIMKPKVPQTPQVEPIKAFPETYQGVTVDSQYIPANTLATYLEGQAWTIDYYSQVLAENDGTASHEAGLSSVYQSYRRIRGLELKLTQPPAPSQDSETAEMSITGEANVYPVLIPNMGDLIIGDMGDGREVLFTLSAQPSRLTHYADTAHSIQFKAIGFMTQALSEELDRKTVETLVFDLDYMRRGLRSLLPEQVLDQRLQFTQHYTRLLYAYLQDFFSHELQTFLVPDQSKITYDPFLVRYVAHLVGVDEHPALQHLQQLNTQQDPQMYEMTLWQALQRLDGQLMPVLVRKMELYPVTRYWAMPMFNSIAYTPVEQVVGPNQANSNVDRAYFYQNQPYGQTLEPGQPRLPDYSPIFQGAELQALDLYQSLEEPQLPAGIHPVTVDDYYVLSRAFYESLPGQSLLEVLIWQALNGEALNLVALQGLCQDALRWNSLERFYYTPLLLTLLRIYPRSL